MKIKYTQEEYCSSNSYGLLTLECEFCGKEFKKQRKFVDQEMRDNRGGLKYCSSLCANEKRRKEKNTSVVCQTCNKVFVKKICEIQKTKNNFCSKSCAATFRNLHLSKELKAGFNDKTSKTLKKRYENIPHASPLRSRRKRDKQERKHKDCLICLKQFVPHDLRTKTCSKNCSLSLKKQIVLSRPIYEKACKNCGEKFSTRKETTIMCSPCCGSSWAFNANNPDYEKNMAKAVENGKKSAQSQNRRSKNEIMFADLCKEKYPDALFNEPMFNGWDCDVVIPSLKIAIMWNGQWHYLPIVGEEVLKRTRRRDTIKAKMVKRHGYDLYIVNDPGKENKLFVEKSFALFEEYLSSKLDNNKQNG